MNSDEICDMTLINTTWVRRAERGIVNVPSTQEAHEVKKYLHALDDRLAALEDSVNQIRTLMPYMDKPAPLPCCEGCADFPCTRSEVSGFLIENSLSKLHPHPSCYRYFHCEDCAFPWNNADDPDYSFWLLCYKMDNANPMTDLPRRRSPKDITCSKFRTKGAA